MMARCKTPLLALLLGLASALSQASGLADVSSSDANAGLKAALAKGAQYAVASLGKENGFLGNSKVAIAIPESLKGIEKTLRTFGMSRQADELIETMNHAAEQAVAQAGPILLDAVQKMSLKDAKEVLLGGEDSATLYFKRSTSEALSKTFKPIVKRATQKVQLGEKYNEFAGKAASFGLIDAKDADLDSYVTQKSLDGLFTLIAEQEKNLRAHPLSAGSDLLKKVFSAL